MFSYGNSSQESPAQLRLIIVSYLVSHACRLID